MEFGIAFMTSSDRTHNIFELLDHLGELEPDELLEHFTEDNVSILKAAATMLKEGAELERYLSEKRFIEVVRELGELKKIWSAKLDQTLANASDAFNKDEKVRAIWILEGFTRFCPSPYYRDVAERVLEEYREG
jgi:hypothetical protein